jgi:hypothetical protein
MGNYAEVSAVTKRGQVLQYSTCLGIVPYMARPLRIEFLGAAYYSQNFFPNLLT